MQPSLELVEGVEMTHGSEFIGVPFEVHREFATGCTGESKADRITVQSVAAYSLNWPAKAGGARLARWHRDGTRLPLFAADCGLFVGLSF
jgi:hypothetical protein